MSTTPTPNGQTPAAMDYPEAEAALVSCVLQGGAPVFVRAQDRGIKAPAFERAAHRAVWQACTNLVSRGANCSDPVLVVAELRTTGALEVAGHEAGVQALLEFAPGSLCIDHYAELVYRAWCRRLAVRAGSKIAEVARGLADWDEYRSEIDRILSALGKMSACARNTSQRSHADTVLRRLQDEIAGNRDRSREITAGITSFDKRLGPFDAYFGEYYSIIAGGSSDGKSTLARQVAAENLLCGRRVAIFIREGGVEDVIRALAGYLARVNHRDLDKLTPPEQQRMLEKTEQVRAWLGERLWVWDDISIVEDLVNKVRWLVVEHGTPDLIIADYAQLFRTSRRMNNREQEVAAVSVAFRNLANELQRQVLVLAQLARDVLREGRRPTKHDLRESQALVNDCDRLVILYGPKETCHGATNDTHQVHREMHLLQEKSRNGRTGMVPTWFRKDISRFEALTAADEAALRDRDDAPAMTPDTPPPPPRKGDWKAGQR